MNRCEMNALIVLGALLWSGCDFAVDLRPEGEPKQAREWTRSFGDLQLTSWGIGNLVGHTHAGMGVELRNRGTRKIVVKEVQLLARAMTYEGKFGSGLRREFEVEPLGVGQVELSWDLDDTIDNVTAKGCTVIFRLETAGQLREVNLPLKRMD